MNSSNCLRPHILIYSKLASPIPTIPHAWLILLNHLSICYNTRQPLFSNCHRHFNMSPLQSHIRAQFFRSWWLNTLHDQFPFHPDEIVCFPTPYSNSWSQHCSFRWNLVTRLCSWVYNWHRIATCEDGVCIYIKRSFVSCPATLDSFIPQDQLWITFKVS